MKAFHKVLIITNHGRDLDGLVTEKIVRIMETGGHECFHGKKDGTNRLMKDSLPNDVDLAIVIGGDGSIIEAARLLKGRGTPILGVNMGTLGYLAEIEIDNIDTAFSQLNQERFIVENRIMIEGSINNGDKEVALNDIVVSRKGLLRVIHFTLYVNGEYLNSYEADGIIVSTPTGSTAYNLSAGGPIVKPTADMIVITPICAHALQSSSIVLSSTDQITIEIGKGKFGKTEEAYATFDGSGTEVMMTDDTLVITKAKEVTKLVKINKYSFLEVLGKKMREK